jgi:8-oxo-dGTP diphosphatase
MTAPSRFNIRVYGIWIHEGRVLVNEELIRGKMVTKFPGGGLEPGEGTIEGLKREWQEELGIDVEITEHCYTTDFYQHSAYDDSQVISIYYRVSGTDPLFAITNHEQNERTYWMPLGEVSEATFTLPIDKIVGGMLKEQYNSGLI